jgi:hypothetical protein
LIKARLEQGMGNSTTWLKVEMNANVDLLRRYNLERKKVAEENGGDANEVWLWHATSSNGAEKSIVENGFDLNRCGLDFDYSGAGTYLTLDCELSNRRCKVRDAEHASGTLQSQRHGACFWSG